MFPPCPSSTTTLPCLLPPSNHHRSPNDSCYYFLLLLLEPTYRSPSPSLNFPSLSPSPSPSPLPLLPPSPIIVPPLPPGFDSLLFSCCSIPSRRAIRALRYCIPPPSILVDLSAFSYSLVAPVWFAYGCLPATVASTNTLIRPAHRSALIASRYPISSFENLANSNRSPPTRDPLRDTLRRDTNNRRHTRHCSNSTPRSCLKPRQPLVSRERLRRFPASRVPTIWLRHPQQHFL